MGIALFDMNNVKFAFIVIPDPDVKRCTSLFVAGAVGDRPSERLKNFVQLRISRMESLWEFRLSSGFPVPNRPFAMVMLYGRLNPRGRDDSFAVIVHSVFKEALLPRNVVACRCSNILQNELL
jgi:hypothetical protein